MRIAVIAASGQSGQVFVETALAAGHSVHAGIRRTCHVKPHPQLTLIPCDATKARDLRKLLANQEAVVSFIGHVKNSAPSVQTVATQKTIQVMHEIGIKRFVSLTGTGARFPRDTVTFVDRILNLAVNILDPDRVQDGRNHVELLKNSDLEWTVIRVLKLQNVSPKPFSLREHGPTKWFVGRGEVAQAVLQVLTQHSFITQAPIISNA